MLRRTRKSDVDLDINNASGSQLPLSTKMIELRPSELHFLSSYLKEIDKQVLTSRCEQALQATQDLPSYRTIQSLNWLQPQVHNHRAYKTLRSDFQNDYPPKVAELGCCFGTDVRQLVLDGLPSSNILAVDINAEYWDVGMNLFQDKETLKAKTVFCDTTQIKGSPLDEFIEKYDVVYALLVLHVFDKDEGKRFMARAFQMLAPGGVFFGTTVGRKEDQVWEGKHRWLYGSDGLKKALKDAGFEEATVERVDFPERMSHGFPGGDGVNGNLCWSFVAKKTLPEWSSC